VCPGGLACDNMNQIEFKNNFNKKISGNFLGNDDRMLKGSRGLAIVWHGGVNGYCL